MPWGHDTVTEDTVMLVFNNCWDCDPYELRDLVEQQLGQNFRKSTIDAILRGEYDLDLVKRPLPWPTQSRFRSGGSSKAGRGSRKPSKTGAKGGGNAGSDTKLTTLLKGKTSWIIIAIIAVYIFRDQLLDLLIALAPLIGGLAALAVMGLILKNMLSGKSLFAGKSASGSKGKKSTSATGKVSLPGTVVLIGLLLMAMKLLSQGALPAAAVSAGLGVFIFKISSR